MCEGNGFAGDTDATLAWNGPDEESWGLSKVVIWVNKHKAASFNVKSYGFCSQSWTILQYSCVETEGRFVIARKSKTSVFRWVWVLFCSYILYSFLT